MTAPKGARASLSDKYVNRPYRDILKHSSVYALGQILVRAASIAMLPLYTNCLTPSDYGVIAILDLFAGVTAIVIGADLAQAAARYHFDTECRIERDKVWWSSLSILGVLVAAACVVGCLLRDPLASLLLGPDSAGGLYVALMLATAGVNALGGMISNYLRVLKRSFTTTLISLGQLVLNIVLNVVLLVEYDMGVTGVLTGNLIASAVSLGVQGGFFVHTRGRFRWDSRKAAKLCRFAAPLVVTALLSLLLHYADRALVQAFVGLKEVGIYALAYTIGHAANTLCLAPFDAIWSVVVYEVSSDKDAKHVYAKIFEYFVYGLAIALLGAALCAKPFLKLVASPAYHEAASIVPIICLAYFLFSLHLHFCAPALLAKRTARMLPPHVLAVLVNLGGNLMLIPILGAVGAAWASVAAFAAFSLGGLIVYRRIDVVPYPFWRCGLAVAGIIATFVIVDSVSSAWEGVGARVLLAVGVCGAWAALLFGRPAWVYLARRKRTARLAAGGIASNA